MTDATEFDWPILKTSEFRAAYRIVDGAATVLRAANDHNQDTDEAAARAALAAGAAADAVVDGTTFFCQSRRRSCVAHLPSGLVLSGGAGLNLGLAVNAFRDLGDEPVPAVPVPAAPGFDDPALAALWALLERLDRTELPRKFTVACAGQQLVLHAANGRIFAPDVADPAAALAELGRGVGSETPLSYALDQDTSQAVPAEGALDALDLAIGIVGGDTDTDHWKFDPAGWPVGCPASAGFAAANARRVALHALAGWGRAVGAENGIKALWLDHENRPALSLLVHPDGTADAAVMPFPKKL